MILKILSLSKTKSEQLKAIEAEYLKRASQIKVLEPRKNFTEPKQECEWFRENLSKADFIISLDEKGKQFNTADFSNYLKNQQNKGKSSFLFVVGSAYGLPAEIRNKSNLIWGLSELTFPFQIARMLVVEQLYRVICNINGHPYHKP